MKHVVGTHFVPFEGCKLQKLARTSGAICADQTRSNLAHRGSISQLKTRRSSAH